MLRILFAALVAVSAVVGGGQAFAQSCSSPPPEPKTSALPTPDTTQPG